MIAGVVLGEPAEIDDEDGADENLEDEDEFDLGFEIGFAGEIDGLGDLAHGAVDGEVFHAAVDDQAEEKPEAADGHSPGEEGMAADGITEESGRVEVGDIETYFAGAGWRKARGEKGEGERRAPGASDGLRDLGASMMLDLSRSEGSGIDSSTKSRLSLTGAGGFLQLARAKSIEAI